MRIESVSLAISRALAAAVLLTAAVGSVSPASAQGAFCTRGAGFTLQGGFCTDGVDGAFSAAALSSQSLNQVTQSVTQQSDQKTAEAIDRRRTEEQQRQQVAPQRQQERAAAPAPAKKGKKVARAPARAPSGPVFKSDPGERMAPVPYIQPVRPAVWAQAFGDYERRSPGLVIVPIGVGIGGVGGPGGGPGGPGAPGGITVPTPFNIGSKAETWGFIGGADLTFRNVFNPSDGLILGVLTGYSQQDIRFRNQSNLQAHVEGPSVGVFASFFNGGFSGDLTFKADFFDLSQNWAEVQVYGSGATFLNIGAGETDFVNYTVQGNLNYRIPINPVAFIEPTVGFRYIRSDYAAGAGVLFGLADGEVWRIQGGARLGANYDMGNMIVTPSITGLAYSDVSITGGVLNSIAGPFTSSAGGIIVPDDEGKIRGQGILNINFDWKNGVQAFVEGNVRGGDDLWGYGGRGGIRVQF